MSATRTFDRSQLRALLAVVLLGAAIRIALAASIGLGVDESYEVVVARHLALGYFDHPPLSFWIAGAVERLAGTENRIALRLPFIALFAGTTWLMFRLGARLFGESAGLWAAVLFNVSPVFSVSTGGWVLPDGPLMFFILAATVTLLPVLLPEEGGGIAETGERAAEGGGEVPEEGGGVVGRRATLRWVAGGAFAGLAMLSKYHGVFVPAGVLLFLLTRRESRHWLRRPGPYLASALALAIFTPVLIWNAEHGWVSFLFQGGRGVPRGLHPVTLLQSLAGQAAYLLPWIWVPLLWVLAKALRRGPQDGRAWLLCCLAIGPIVVFTLPALGGRPGLPHWEAPGYLMLFPLLGDATDRLLRKRGALVRPWLWASSTAFCVLLAVAASQTATGWIEDAAPGLFRRGDPSWQAVDWTGLGAALQSRGMLAADSFVGAPTWVQAAKASYALGPGIPVTCLCADPHEFGLLHPPESYEGRDAVLLKQLGPRDRSDEAAARLAADFSGSFRKVTPEGDAVIHRFGRPAFRVALALGLGFHAAGHLERDAAAAR